MTMVAQSNKLFITQDFCLYYCKQYEITRYYYYMTTLVDAYGEHFNVNTTLRANSHMSQEP